MGHFSTKQGALFYSYTMDVEQQRKIDGFLALLDRSGVGKFIELETMKEDQAGEIGRPGYDPYKVFACVLFGFSMGSSSLRDLEASCMNDIRYMYLMECEKPSYSYFCTFINRVIRPHCEQIFAMVTSEIFRSLDLEIDDCFIDGTKFEAFPNKYKVVWKPTFFYGRLDGKIRALFQSMGLARGVPSDGLIPSEMIARKLSEAQNLMKTGTGGIPEGFGQMEKSLSEYLIKVLEYEEKERICGPDRNSYYKTDHDATAMCLKEDYYSGLGSNLHPAYQIQSVICHGFVLTCYVSQDRTDIYTFIPTFETFHRLYGIRPRRICADSGYGCLQNYRYCSEHGIVAFVKYQSWEGECSGRRPALYELNDDNSITCLGGRIGFKTEIPGRHHRAKGTTFYLVEGCTGCPFMPYCRQFMKEKSCDSKVFEFNPELQRFKQKARDLLLSVEGIEMRVNRSCQAEGNFGTIKYDMFYDRIRRTGKQPVTMEMLLTSLGYNLRKYMRYSETGVKLKWWTAPEGMTPEKFKKPSAKRLANRVLKKRQKSVNEEAKSGYKYKKIRNKKEGVSERP